MSSMEQIIDNIITCTNFEYLTDEEPQEKKQTPAGEQYQTKTLTEKKNAI